MSRSEVLVAEVFIRSPERWMTLVQTAESAGVKWDVAKTKAARLVGLGVLDVVPLHGGHRYRLHPEPSDAAKEYLSNFDRAKEALAIPAATT